MKLKFAALLMAILLTAGCFAACSDPADDNGDSESASPVESTRDEQSEENTEADTEEDTEADTEADTEEDTEADTEEDTEADTEEDTEADTEEDTEADTEEDTEADTEDEDEEEEERLIPKLYKLTSSTEGVKILGERNLASENSLHMDWSCSGAEFTIDLKGGSIRFNFIASNSCMFRVWVDGEVYKQNGSEYFTIGSTNGTIALNGITPGKHTIKIMKVTGYTLARAELTSVTFAGDLLTDTDTSDKELYIEFVGDSITCGWGTIGNHTGAYSDQDGTLAYSYLLAEALGADYSMTALSGQGLLCGAPGVTNGYLYASPLKDNTNQYSFERKADIVVINIGTNDYSKKVGEAEFKAAYKSFLQTVKEKNGKECKILCLYNTMNDTYANAILEACREMGGELEAIVTYKLDRASGTTPNIVGHPTAEENKAYAEVLKDIILNLPERFDPTLNVIPEGDGDDDVIDFEAF